MVAIWPRRRARVHQRSEQPFQIPQRCDAHMRGADHDHLGARRLNHPTRHQHRSLARVIRREAADRIAEALLWPDRDFLAIQWVEAILQDDPLGTAGTVTY